MQIYTSYTTNQGNKLLSSNRAVGDRSNELLPEELRLHIYDFNTNKKLLIDSGSVVSIISANYGHKQLEKDPLALGAQEIVSCILKHVKNLRSERHIIPYSDMCAGQNRNIKVALMWLKIVQTLENNVEIIDHKFLISGHSFLPNDRHFCLVEMSLKKNNLLFVPQDQYKIIKKCRKDNNFIVNEMRQEDFVLTKLLEEAIFKRRSQNLQANQTSPTFSTFSVPKDPVIAYARKLGGEKAEAAKVQLTNMLEKDIIRSSIHMCLNASSEQEMYPPSLITDFFLRLTGICIYTKFDLEKAYYQVPMYSNDIQKTAIITPWGLLEYVVMPFGLKNAIQTFQRFIDEIFQDLDFVFVYIDDILIMSKNEQEHQEHFQTVFELLMTYSLSINNNKCVLRQTEVNFLGYSINSQDYVLFDERVNAILNYTKTETIEKLRRFLGMISYYKRCKAQAAHI
ncbi:uncharacterized protein LOC124428160 [Vespa crabro]|uniref:uncharacterized protein LOC124428160 n=1 Tax=Vespa crabro TaxID=7445 RepID=UPI001F02865C|nr:uncharacterized protein LOC124428160 [Vespa crabro]